MTPAEPDRVAQVLADAFVIGDGPAAKKWGLSKRSVYRYRAQAVKDPKLAALVAVRKSEAQHDLATLRVAFLRDALVAMRGKFEDASLEEIAEAVKVIGDQHQVAMAVDDERHDSPDPEAAEAEGGAGASAH